MNFLNTYSNESDRKEIWRMFKSKTFGTLSLKRVKKSNDSQQSQVNVGHRQILKLLMRRHRKETNNVPTLILIIQQLGGKKGGDTRIVFVIE